MMEIAMQRRNKKFNRRASVLILALWTVAFLSLFAVYIGLRIRQRVSLLARIEQRSQLRFLAEAGIKKAIAVLRDDIRRNGFGYSPYAKYNRHNNPEHFKDGLLPQGVFNVIYHEGDGGRVLYGFIDEERKLNINFIPARILKQLIQEVAVPNDEEAERLAAAIVDWRTFGRSETTGFYSDDYYYNLPFPYEPKNMEFETYDELLLIKGMTPEIYKRLLPFITIYGDGRFNVNTASREILTAMDLSPSLVDKLIKVRQGLDGTEATVDDHIFLKPFDLASEIGGFLALSPEEAGQIDSLNKKDLLKTSSSYYFIQSEARLNTGPGRIVDLCVYNATENRIEYWREKFLFSFDNQVSF
jgi:type II secretory pathway component PulK